MKKNRGFTLAEVLITLAIIGIVAALTIPSVVQSYKKHVYSTRIKKFVSTMHTILNNSRMDEFVFFRSGGYAPLNANVMSKLEEYTQKYARVDVQEHNDAWTVNGEYPGKFFVFSDGSLFTYDRQWESNLIIAYDVNGLKGPNVGGIDRFEFYICPGIVVGYNGDYCRKLNALEPKWFGDKKGATSREDALEKCKKGTYNNMYCTQLLWYDGLEFKKDYPLKL